MKDLKNQSEGATKATKWQIWFTKQILVGGREVFVRLC